MRYLIPAALLLCANSARAAEECPAQLIYQAPEIGETDRQIAQQYAGCVSFGWLPTPDRLQAKLADCKGKLPSEQSSVLEDAIRWVDHIAGGLGGCETALEIRAKP